MEELHREKRRRERGGFFSRISAGARESLERRRGSLGEGVFDLLTLLVGFIFARCHLIFGAYPLGLAFAALLPCRVWLGTLGVVLGSLTMGRSGIIYAMISLIVVFLRIIVSGTDREGDEDRISLFHEGLLLRMSAATIGGFITAIYEIMLSGFSLTSVAFGASMVVLPPIVVFALSGLFDAKISFRDLIFTDAPLFSKTRISEGERFSIIFYQCSALLLIFLISLSLKDYSLLGISFAYVFASLLTLAVARRFGALRGAVAGFAATFGISGELSVAFALMGLASGALFKLGMIYALAGGLLAAGAWGMYVGGVNGLVSILPELSLGAVAAYPLLKRTRAEKSEDSAAECGRAATDMVGTMALAYRNKYVGALGAMEAELSRIAAVVRRYNETTAAPTREELSELVYECTRKWCRDCESGGDCSLREELSESSPEICAMSAKLLAGERILATDFDTLPTPCHEKEALAESVNRAVAILAREKFSAVSHDGVAEALELLSRLISEAKAIDDRERSADEELSEKLGVCLSEAGLADGVIRVFGERRRHFILAAEDASGERITSPALRSSIERIAGVKLGSPEYFRRGEMALMECTAMPVLSAECATCQLAGSSGELSGDSVQAGESSDARFYSVISDGMGSGELAHGVSSLVCDFLSRAMDFGTGGESTLKLLNHSVKANEGECSATVDLFTLDLLRGEAVFLKSGAAPSFIKRGSSIFRIRSRTAPLGLLKELDCEKIRADVEPGDYVIMLSDGISSGLEEASWLLELLSKPKERTVQEYAEYILREARHHGCGRDDMTVAVVKIKKA